MREQELRTENVGSWARGMETPGTVFSFFVLVQEHGTTKIQKNDSSSADDDTMRNRGVFMKNGLC